MSVQSSETATLIDKLSALLARRDLRSADRASMAAMHKLLRKGRQLSYQERQNLWAYFNRYGVDIVLAGRP